MASAPANHERQFSLILALMATSRGLTKAQIFSTVHGYQQRSGTAATALDKLFERDKLALRRLGVPIETIGDPGDKDARYRIPKSAYDLPADVRFSPGELSILGLAAEVWRDGSLSADSRRALTKLRGLGVAAGDPVIGFLPLVRSPGRALDRLRGALDDGRVVEFDYLKPMESAPTRRRVSPLALILHEGRWLLLADQSGQRRTFLLSRIVGEVTVTKSAAVAPTPDDEPTALAELSALWERQTALVAVAPGSDAEVRIRNRRGAAEIEPGVFELHYTDPAILADELLELQPEATALAPRALIDRLADRLHDLAAAHE